MSSAPGEASTSQTVTETPAPALSKAEISRQRRETQEKQRAAKAAAKASGVPGPQTSSKKPAATAPATPTQSGSKKVSSQKGHAGKPPKDAPADEDPGSRGSRMFSHFGLPKPTTHLTKGEIHPVIVQLALQFAEFKISGANARCIATLTAFKTVRFLYNFLFSNLIWLYRSFKTM